MTPYKHPEKYKTLIVEMARKGNTKREIARSLRIHHDTIYEWLKNFPDFKAKVEAAEIEAAKEKPVKRSRRYGENIERELVFNILFRTVYTFIDYGSSKYIGCSPGFLRNHIESLFKAGMTWENYGQWHVDHIVPLSWFPIDEDPSLIYVASHWSNLAPKWKKENLLKGNRYAR